MSIDFSNIKLEAIDLNINSSPDIFINHTGITFSRRILEDLNYPQNVQYCVDPSQNIFAIRVCKSNEQRATSFSKSKGEQTKSFNTNNKALRKTLTSFISKYNEEMKYKITGELDSENRVMYFDMKGAEVF